MATERPSPGGVSRRGLLRAGVAIAGARALGAMAAAQTAPVQGTLIGIFADPHFADRATWADRHYRDSPAKLAQFVEAMNQAKPAFVIGLGDFVDKASTLREETAYLKRVQEVYAKFTGQRHHVMGNHDLATFTKEQFAAGTGMPGPHYSFDAGEFHFVVLDANYRKDFTPYRAGNFRWTETYIPPEEGKWLAADLKATPRATVIFVHQTLDDENGSHGVKNAPDVRRLLERSRKVLAVFQGHNHRGAYRRINGIDYFTMHAIVEGSGLKNNAFALAQVTDRGVRVRGFAKQPDRP